MVTKTEILTLTKKLITIPSTRDNLNALDNILHIVQEVVAPTFVTKRFESNKIPSLLIHNSLTKNSRYKIILNAHLDVVPGKREQYQPEERDGYLYGRGAYDMKAAAAVMILVFNEIANQVSYPIALQIVTDEENSSENSTQYQIKQGVRGDFIICGECSSNLDIIHKSKGALWFTLTAAGSTAHGGYPWRGENALWKLTDTLYKIRKLYPVPSKEAWVTTINLARIETSNKTFNAVPEEATAHIDLRFVHEDQETVLEKIKQVIPANIKLTIVQNTNPTFISEDNNYITQLRKHIERTTNKKAHLRVAHATSDLRFYNDVGCLGIEFGVVGKNQHGDNECVEIKSLFEYYNILKNFLLSLS